MRADAGPRYAPEDFEPHLVDEVPIRGVEQAGGRIPEGRRNETLFRLACSMRARGFEEEAILAAISVANRTQCDPPLPEDEVRRLVRSACRYDPGPEVGLENPAVPAGPENDSAAAPLLRAAESVLPFRTAREIIDMTPEDVP